MKKLKNQMLVAKVNNDSNLLTLPRLSLTQKKMFQLVLALTRAEGEETHKNQTFFSRFFNPETRTIEIEFSKFYKLVNGDEWKIKAVEVGAMVDDMLQKLLHTILSYEDEYRILKFVCFEKAEYVRHEQLVRITIQKDFYEMITNFKNGFTLIDYFEYCTLNSIYSQNLYPLLKQFRNTGFVTLFRDKWEQFCSIMQFPEKATMQNIDKILKQVVAELSSEKTLFDQKRIPFKNLTYTKIKDNGRGRGGKVVGIEFRFSVDKESKLIQQSNDYFTEDYQAEIKALEKKHIDRRHIEGDRGFYYIKLIVFDFIRNKMQVTLEQEGVELEPEDYTKEEFAKEILRFIYKP